MATGAGWKFLLVPGLSLLSLRRSLLCAGVNEKLHSDALGGRKNYWQRCGLGQRLWYVGRESGAETLSCSCCIISPAELRAGLWQGITAHWSGWQCQVKMPEEESAGGLSNICSSLTKFFLLQSLKVLHYSRRVQEPMRGDCLEMSVNCHNYLVAVIKQLTHIELHAIKDIFRILWNSSCGHKHLLSLPKTQAAFFPGRQAEGDEQWQQLWLLFSASLYAGDAPLTCGSFPVQSVSTSESLGISSVHSMMPSNLCMGVLYLPKVLTILLWVLIKLKIE